MAPAAQPIEEEDDVLEPPQAAPQRQQVQQQQQPAPPRQVPPRQVTVGELLQQADECLIGLRRAYAGCNHLNEALAAHMNPPPPGQRRKGLPIFNYRASADGVKAEEIAVDLKNVEPEYIPHVLVPLINAHIPEIQHWLSNLKQIVVQVEQTIMSALPNAGQAEPAQPQQPQAAPPPRRRQG